MNRPPQVGQWYVRLDTKEVFLVTGYDDKSRTIETQAVDGDLDEIDEGMWNVVPLAFSEPPEEWTQAVDDRDAAGADEQSAPIERFLPL
jgi:hypothetical protein